MRGLVGFFLVIAVLALLSFMALSFSNRNEIAENNHTIQFKTFTSAVCEEINGIYHCRDRLFVNCNGKIYSSDEIKECNGFEIDNKISGSAVFGEDWQDPRA